MNEPRTFFPILVRRKNYAVKSNGGYYGYGHYREEVAEDCHHRCVYCDAHANEVGGAEAMQLDHFRPESFEEYSHLINDPNNLHYACGRCNLWKSDWWPARGTADTHNGRDGFVDPFNEDRLQYFQIAADGSINPLLPPAGYQIRLLRLDREFLRKLRELRMLRQIWKERVIKMRQNAEQGKTPDPAELIRTLQAIESLLG